LYLIDAMGRLLLQRRSASVDHYPGALTISVLGHIDAGESSMDAAEREIQEELGLDPATLSTRFLFSYRREATISDDYIDRQFNDVYVSSGNFDLSDIIISREEVSAVELMDFDEFARLVERNAGEIVDVYRDECRDILYLMRQRMTLARDITKQI
jgi:isopentenyl-diphosphate delta-isomerase